MTGNTDIAAYRWFAVPDAETVEDNSNAHVCIYPDLAHLPCLACALKALMGEDRWTEALNLAADLALMDSSQYDGTDS